MGQPAAKQGDTVTATDIHIEMVPSPGGPVPTPLPNPFNGKLMDALSEDVNIEGKPAATVNSIAKNMPPHVPKSGPFQNPPNNEGTVMLGSGSVFINGQPAARNGDKVMTCNDPAPLPNGTIIAAGTVMIGG